MLRLTRARAPRRVPVARLVLFTLAAGALACAPDRVTTTRERGVVVVASGNAQRGVPGQRLAAPIVVVVRDESSRPASGVRVTWIAEDGGTIDPAASTTDDDGHASATWTLGGGVEHRGRAVAEGYAAVEFTASAASDGELTLDVIQPLDLTTYDHSGQTVHPDFVSTGPEWPAAGAYLFITPYPNGNANFENPSIYEGTGMRWTPPNGVTNPLFAPGAGYYSDPDALYVPERNELWLYFRQVTNENIIRLTTSRDGVAWTAPAIVARAPNHQIISPAIVHRGPAEWLMWTVNGNVGCSGAAATLDLRRSLDGLTWSKPEPVELSQPGVFPWHIDVQWIPSRGEYWALFNGKTAGSCTTAAVYLATSTDGVHWATYPSPVLAHGASRELQDVVYRSTFSYDAASDVMTIWYSGARVEGANYVWHSAVQRRRRADLFAAIGDASRASAPLADRTLPPLRDFP